MGKGEKLTAQEIRGQADKQTDKVTSSLPDMLKVKSFREQNF